MEQDTTSAGRTHPSTQPAQEERAPNALDQRVGAVADVVQEVMQLLWRYDRVGAKAKLDAVSDRQERTIVLNALAKVGTGYRDRGGLALELAAELSDPPIPREALNPAKEAGYTVAPRAVVSGGRWLDFCYQDPRDSRGQLRGGFRRRAIPCDDGLAHVGIHEGDHVDVWCSAGPLEYPDGTVMLAELRVLPAEDDEHVARYLGILGHDAAGQPLLHYDGPSPWARTPLGLARFRIAGEVVAVCHQPGYGNDCTARWPDDRQVHWRWCRYGVDAGGNIVERSVREAQS